MKWINSHIQEYLDNYIQIENPWFAVLVKWQWWSWKTYFIKNWIEKQKNTKDIIYISLYWIERISQIDSKLVIWMIWNLDWKSDKLFSRIKVLGVMLSDAITKHIDKKYDISLPNIWFSELTWVFDYSSKTIIFDDLERFKAWELSIILGYINELVEHKMARVVILWDESKITDESIKQTKEKTIWKTLHFEAEYDSVIDTFIKNISTIEVREMLEEGKSDIWSIFFSSKLNNLRIIRQSLLEFERFFMFFNKELRSVKEFQHDVLSLFLILSLEIHSGNITNLESDLDTILKIDWGDIMGRSEKPNELKESIKKKYVGFDSLIWTLANKDIWNVYFEKNLITEELLNKEVKESLYLDHAPDWLKLWHYRNLEDDTFVSLAKNVFEKLSNKEIENIYEVVHVCTMFIYFSYIWLSTLDKAVILDIGKEEILRLSDQLNPNNHKLSRIRSEAALWYGYHWVERWAEIKENKELLEFLEETIKNMEEQSYKEAAEELLELYRIWKIREAHELLYNKHYNNPILGFIKAEDFLNAFNLVKNERKILIVDGIEKRYERTAANPLSEESFFVELDWLLEIKLASSSWKSISRLYYEKLSGIVKDIIKKIEITKTTTSVSDK
jgi:hypothetical protein